MGSYAGVDYNNLTLCPLQSRLQNIYHGQPYARVDLNPMPESTYLPLRDFGFGLRTKRLKVLFMAVFVKFQKQFIFINSHSGKVGSGSEPF
jgi:hypothetical protein